MSLRSTGNAEAVHAARSTGNVSTGKALSETTEARDRARALLAEGLQDLGMAVAPGQLESLLGLAALLERWAARINLTGHRTLDAIIRRLILEAAALLAQIPGDPGGLADLGSGAGFPGLPIAVLRPSWSLTLVEARQRRHHFQRAAIRELGLENVEVLEGRAEVLEPRARPAVVAQAVARPEQALRWMLPWAEPGGLLLLPGSDPGPEIPEIEGIRFEGRVRYRVPCGGPDRTLWIGRRGCDTP